MLLLAGLYLLALAGPCSAARWSRRQASSETCTCPATAPVTSACVQYTIVTASTTVVSFGGIITSVADPSLGTTTISSVSTTTVTTGTTTIFLAGATRTLASTSTTTSTSYIATTTTCIPTAYKQKRQAQSTTTSLSQPTLSDPSTTQEPAQTVTILSDVVESGTVRRVTCTCTARSTTQSLTGSSSCDCPASTDVTISLSSTVTATNFVFFTATTYATITSTPVSINSLTTVIITTIAVDSTVFQTKDFTQTITPVRTVTTTGTTTVNSCPTPTASCNNQGIRWAAYNNTNASGQNNTNSNPNAGNDNTYSSFDPTVFKTRTPVYTNTTSRLGGFYYPLVQAQSIQIYNSSVYFRSDYLAIDHVGYLFAQVSGAYKFTLTQADDITILWVGANAVSGWTRANANLIDYYDKQNAVYSISLFAGNYYPFRIFYANAQGALQFTASITAPDGTVILNSNSGPSPFLVQFSCNSAEAPAFPAFGSET